MPELPNSISSAPFDFNAYNENRIVEVSKLLSFVAPTIKRLHIFYCPFFKEKNCNTGKNSFVFKVGKLTFAFDYIAFVHTRVSMATCLPTCHSALQ